MRRPVYGQAPGFYGNDGYQDLILAGGIGGQITTRIYRNQGNNGFTNATSSLPGFSGGTMSWGDFDNDGDLDLLVSCRLATEQGVTRVYRNDGGVFVDMVAGLRSLAGSASWGDYDNDGDLDILMSGDNGTAEVAHVFRNNGNGTFTEVGVGLPAINRGTAAWGDYDGDGRLDILLTGRLGSTPVARIYRNNGGGIFTDSLTVLPGVQYGASAWGDFDGDGDLDLALSGGIVRLMQNNNPAPSAPPPFPTHLSARFVSGDTVVLSWLADGFLLGPDRPPLRYNLRVGTTPGGTQIMTPASNLATGQRRLADPGNAGTTNFWRLRLPPGVYYGSVQSVDPSLAGSPFAPEATFTVSAPMITSCGIETNGQFKLHFSGNPGLPYAVTVSSNLVTWSMLGTAVETAPGSFRFIDEESVVRFRFYRVRSQ